MSQWRNTIYQESAPDSPNEKWGSGSSSLTRLLNLKNGSLLGREQAAYDILGYAVVQPTGSLDPMGNPIYYLHRVIPMPAPGLPAFDVLPAVPNDLQPNILPPDLTDALWAIAISKTEPLGPPTGINLFAVPGGTAGSEYQRARITVEFTTLPYQVFDDQTLVNAGGVFAGFPDEGTALSLGWPFTRYIQRHLEPFSRIIKIPYGMMWNVGFPPLAITNLPKQTKVAIPYREGGATVKYTWMRVPIGPTGVGAVNFGRISGSLGTINLNTFDFAPPNTLFFDSFSTREYQGAFGERLADCTFTMIYLPHNSTGLNFNRGNGGGAAAGTPMGWNFIYDIVNGVPDYYLAASSRDGSGQPFVTSDFSTLFRP